MLKVEECKDASRDKPIELMPLPKKVYLPLVQHLGKPCEPVVKVGDDVVVGQRIAAVEAKLTAFIHASISGRVVGIEEWPHPAIGRFPCIVIESDDSERKIDFKPLKDFTPEQIRNQIFLSGIVGMGGAGFPTHIKLTPPKPVDTLIVNGAECEPYLTGDYRLMIERTTQILAGIDLVRTCLGVSYVYIAIEDNKPEAISAFKDNLGDRKYVLRVLKSAYPQGGEKQLIKTVLNKEVPSGKLPFDVGVVVHNVATLFAIYEAVYLGKPLYERVVTVTGSCISRPKNLMVRLGTPIKELIEFCGLKENPAKIIIGGPMMGVAQFSDSVPVIKTTTGVILLDQKESELLEEEFCIRCGACVRGCPVGLMPCLINLVSEKSLWQKAKDLGASDCIECGVCSYVCPANRFLTQSIKRAKLEIAKGLK